MKQNYIYIILFTLLVVSCNVTKPYVGADVETQKLYRDTSITDSSTIAATPWNRFFSDSTLQSLITVALQENLDLKMAVQRIIAAQASFKQSKQAFFPDLNGNLSVKQSRLAFPQNFGLVTNSTQYDIGLSTNWEIDIWGKLSSAKRAAFASYLQTEAVKRAIQSKLIADIATNYYILQALDAQLRVLEKTLENRKEDVQTMHDLKDAAIVTGAAVVQSEANRYTVEVAIPDVKRQIRETENTITILMGIPSAAVRRNALTSYEPTQELAIGVPVQLLRFRPDVQEAELAFRVAFEQTNVARTAFYPNLTITAGAGFSSLDFAQWFTASGFFANVMGGLTQPIFNKGLNKARLTTAQALQQESYLSFSKTLLVAGKEVSDALFALQTARDKEGSRTKQLESLSKAVDFTKELLRYSDKTNYTDVLTSEQNLLHAEMGKINDQLEQWQAIIALYYATGGGAQ